MSRTVRPLTSKGSEYATLDVHEMRPSPTPNSFPLAKLMNWNNTFHASLRAQGLKSGDSHCRFPGTSSTHHAVETRKSMSVYTKVHHSRNNKLLLGARLSVPRLGTHCGLAHVPVGMWNRVN